MGPSVFTDGEKLIDAELDRAAKLQWVLVAIHGAPVPPFAFREILQRDPAPAGGQRPRDAEDTDYLVIARHPPIPPGADYQRSASNGM